MEKRKIRLATIDDVKTFVTRALRCDFDVDIYYNRIVVDAKSILGVLSLDLTRELTVQLHGRDEDFEDYLDTVTAGGEKIA